MSVVPLGAPGGYVGNIEPTAPSTAGTYYYGVCVDSVTGESDTTNNCSAAVAVTVVAPDLAVDTPTVSDNTPVVGASFTLEVTVRNQDSGSSAVTTLRYYQSTDSRITTGDTEVGTDEVYRLIGPADTYQSISLTAPSTAGTYYYGACVDAVAGESDTTNNCSSSITVTVEGSAYARPRGGHSHGQRECPGSRNILHSERHRAQRGRRQLELDDAALLPLERFDDQ